jgi:hypothetical protein
VSLIRVLLADPLVLMQIQRRRTLSAERLERRSPAYTLNLGLDRLIRGHCHRQVNRPGDLTYRLQTIHGSRFVAVFGCLQPWMILTERRAWPYA